MPRQAKLRKKNGHWHTRAGGTDTYFGRVDEVPFKDARRHFGDHLIKVAEERRPITTNVMVVEICNHHLDWCREHRSPALYNSRKSILDHLCNHVVISPQLSGSGALIGEIKGLHIRRGHLDEHLDTRKSLPTKKTGKPVGPVTLRHIVVATKATFNWAADKVEDGAGGLLPHDFRPFEGVRRPFIPPKDLTEADLPTDEEVESLFRCATIDTEKIRDTNGRYRTRRASERRTGRSIPFHMFEDILRVFYATGPRPGEICAANKRNFMPLTQQLMLGKHKRSRTEAFPTLRRLQLGDEAYRIIERLCTGKAPGDPIFTQHDGSRWTTDWLDERFRTVRNLAKVRNHITLYSFRHLYISELLREGIEPFVVAKMAGTSLQEIERTYGHFYNQELAEAQAKLEKARAQRRRALRSRKAG